MKTEVFAARWSLDQDGAWVQYRVSNPKQAASMADAVDKKHRYTIESKILRRKRSLDANAYYWVLLTKLADAVKLSNNAAHNLLLKRYGQPEIVDGQLVYLYLPDTRDAEDTALESETFHLRPTSDVTTIRGDQKRKYILMRGSSTYDSKEMSVLINGLVDECRRIGVETISNEELVSMLGDAP